MKDTSDRFGAVGLSPRRDQPLLQRHGSQMLEALGSSSVSLALCVVSGSDLRPMQKNITSNAMCDVALVLDDGGPRVPYHSASAGTPSSTGDPRTDLKRLDGGHGSGNNGRARSSSRAGMSFGGGVIARSFKSNVVKSSLHPRWNLDVDFGDYNAESVLGVLVTVRHVEKMGLVKRDIGQTLIPLRALLDMKMNPSHEQTFTLEATDETNAREAQEGISNRKYGKVSVRLNGYGAGPPPTSTMTATTTNYTGFMNGGQDLRPTAFSDGSVAHEDDFTSSAAAPRRASGSHNVQAEVKKLQSFHQTKPVPGETWYAIHAQWITNWLLFVSKHKGQAPYNPGEIDNMPLISDDLPDGVFVVRPNLSLKKDFRMINKKSWDFYVALYGGGPAIEVPVPRDCADTAMWLATLRLGEVGRVGSGYFSSDSAM